MARRKRNTWQPNEITSIIRSSQESPDTQQNPDASQSKQLNSPRAASMSRSSNPACEDVRPHQENMSIAKEKSNFEVNHAPEESDSISIFEEGKRRGGNGKRVETRDVHEAQSRSTELTHGPEAIQAELAVPQTQQQGSVTPRKLKRTSSMVRLAMSLDGKASVILCGETPSPPNKKQLNDKVDRSGLQRSQSLVMANKRPALSGDIIPALSIPRVHGRSRDTRTWEFYCDSDVRESLTKTAEHEQRGSAAGPIQLIRSGSAGRRPLAAAPSQCRNSKPLLHRQNSQKRKLEAVSEGPRRKLARVQSSFARLEDSKTASGHDEYFKAKPSSQPTLWRESSGDSDKENRDPDSPRPQTSLRTSEEPKIARQRRKVLQENNTIPSHSTSFGAMLEQEKKQGRKYDKADKENVVIDHEVSDFMASGTANQEEDEMDAVQNLLSLSQGAWA